VVGIVCGSPIPPSVVTGTEETFLLFESQLEKSENAMKLQESTFFSEPKNHGKLSRFVVARTVIYLTVSKMRVSILDTEVKERNAAIMELRDFETVKVTWKIKDFEAKIASSKKVDMCSGDFAVAGYQFCLRLAVGYQEQKMTENQLSVSLYIGHKGGFGFFPISVGGSMLCFSGTPGMTWSFQESDTIENAVPRAFRFSSLGGTKDITVEAFVRVRRLWPCNLVS
jgi:hypothetical protein